MDMKLPDGTPFSIDRFVKRRRSLRNGYSSYQTHHAEIMDNFRPRRGLYLRGQELGLGSSRIDGQKRHQAIINSTVTRAAKNAQSGLQAGVTSPSRPWKRLGPSDHEMLEIPGAREAFDELDKACDFVLSSSNFYRATHTAYGDFVLPGIAALQIDEHADEVLRCQVHPVGSFVCQSNTDGRVDVFYRDYRCSGHEIMQKFGSAVPDEVQKEIRDDPYKTRDLFNAIEPNPFYQGGQLAIGLAAFPFVSVWWLKGHERDFLKIHGYHEFPVMVFRFATSELGDTYGEGPGYDALGEAKQLQHQENTKLMGLDKMVLPPLQAPTSLRQAGVSLIPGHVTYHDGQNKVESIYNVNLPLSDLRADIQDVERRISEIFFEDLFLMITQGVSRQITAREVEERHEEKLIMLGPVLESIHDELLDPAIKRVLAIMRRRGMWPDFPDQLEGVEIKIEYTSILAQAQRAVQTIAIEQGFNFVGAGAQLLPEMLDRVDPDGLVDEYFERIGFPAQATRSVREATGLREARAQAQAQQSQADALAQGAATAKDAAGATDLIKPNILQQVLRGVA